MRFGSRLWVCPEGMEVDADEAVVVRLDPGLAFGTGTHPTTAMCLEWLDSIDLENKSVLDYGCGSGVLAIAAAIVAMLISFPLGILAALKPGSFIDFTSTLFSALAFAIPGFWLPSSCRSPQNC